MKFKEYNNEKEFLEENEYDLLLDEDINNTMLDVINQVEKEKVLFRIENDSRVELIGLITKAERKGLILYIKNPKITIDVYKFLVNEIISRNIELREIKAIKGISDIIFDLYSERKKVNLRSHKTFYLMKLNKLSKLNNVSNALRIADMNDLEFEKNMVLNISSETLGIEIDDERAYDIAKVYIKKGLYFLVDKSSGEILSQAATTKTSKNGYTIGAVYTPKNNRRKGYAKECLYKLIQKIQDEKKDIIVLYSNVEEIGNKKLYECLGFEILLEETVIKF